MENKKDSSEWELSKENIQPIKQGRKVEILQTALAIQPDDKIQEKIRMFEQELRSYTGDDILSVWCDYIKWVEQNFPKGGRDGKIFKLVQKCLSVLEHEKRYYEDDRFVDIWLKFASLTSRPMEVFARMNTLKIGYRNAKFYQAWAWELEQLGNMKKADEVLLDGINKNAQPLDLLKSTHKGFEVRLCKTFSKDPEIKCSMLEGDAEERAAFTLLKRQEKNKAPISRVGSSTIPAGQESLKVKQQIPQKHSTNKFPFKIYSADNKISSLPTQSEATSFVAAESESRKENEKNPGKWTRAKVPQITAAPTKSPGFDFHGDKTPPPSSKKTQEPLLVKSGALTVRKPSASSIPRALFEPPDPKMRPMYNKLKVYGGAEEFSFEEIRAAAWFKQKKKKEKEIERLREIEEKKEMAKNMQMMQEKLVYLENMLSSLKPNKESVKPEAGTAKLSSSEGLHCRSSNNGSRTLSSLSSPKLKCSADESGSTLGDQHGACHDNSEDLQPSLEKPDVGKLQSKGNGGSHKKISDSTMISNMVQELYNGTLTYKPKDLHDLPEPALSFDQNLKNIHENVEPPVSANAQNFFPVMKTYQKSLTPSFQSLPDYQPCVQKESDPALTHEPARAPMQGNQFVPFPIYQDESEQENMGLGGPNQLPLDNDHHEVETEAMSKKENIPPVGFQQVAEEKRELVGILKPSKNIHFIPLDEQDEQETDSSSDDEDDNDYLAAPLPGDTENFTIIPPLNAEHFAAAARFASTPCLGVPNVPPVGDTAEESGAIDRMPPPARNAPVNSAFVFNNLYTAIKASDVQKVEAIVSHILDNFSFASKEYSSIRDNLKACINQTNCQRIRTLMERTVQALDAASASAATMGGKLWNLSCTNQQKGFCDFQLSTIMENSREGSTKSSSSSCSSVDRSKPFSRNSHWSLARGSIAESMVNSTNCKSFSGSVTSAKIDIGGNCDVQPRDGQNFLHKLPVTMQFCSGIDPFDPKLTLELIKSIKVPVSQRKTYHFGVGSLKSIRPRTEIKAGNLSYIIERQVAEGAYSKVYMAHLFERNMFDENQSILASKSFAVKVCEGANEWEFYICSEVNDRLQEKKHSVDATDSVVQIRAAISYCDGIALVSDMAELGTILDIVNLYRKKSISKGTVIPEILVMYFTLEMLMIISSIHKCGIVHGDVKPDNFVLNSLEIKTLTSESLLTKTKSLRLIDFGRSIDLTLFKPGITFNQVVKTDSFQCPEMIEGKPWVFQPDWYGVLACIHVMLFGEYMTIQKNDSGVWMPTKRFKRYWQVDIWQGLFNDLLNIPSSYEVPDLKPVMENLAARLQRDIQDLKRCLRDAQHYAKN